MRRFSLALAVFAGFAAPAVAQGPTSLETPVKNFQLPRQLPECGLEAVLLRLAKESDARIGFERTTQCRGHQAFGFPEALKPLDVTNAEVLDGRPLKEVLARIAALTPDYDWAVMDGVAVFRPSDAWKDPSDALGAHVPAIRFSDVPASRVVGAVLNLPAVKGEKHRLSIDFPGGTVLEAFNALARSQSLMWYASSDGEKLFVWVMFSPHGDGLGVAAPITGLVTR